MSKHPQNNNPEIISKDGTINEERLSRRLKLVLDMLETSTAQQGEATGILADLSTQVEAALKDRG